MTNPRAPSPDIASFRSMADEIIDLADAIHTLSLQMDADADPSARDLISRIRNGELIDWVPDDVPGPGDAAPSFSLESETGPIVSLDELIRCGPALLLFYRGSWCPFCNLTLRAFHAAAHDFAARSISIAAVSPEPPDLSTLGGVLRFPVLWDEGGATAEAFGLRYRVPQVLEERLEVAGVTVPRDATGNAMLPVSGAFLVDQSARIMERWVSVDYRHRVSPQTIFETLAAIRG